MSEAGIEAEGRAGSGSSLVIAKGFPVRLAILGALADFDAIDRRCGCDRTPLANPVLAGGGDHEGGKNTGIWNLVSFDPVWERGRGRGFDGWMLVIFPTLSTSSFSLCE